jgi:molybdopterin-containing oxidoreductase family iron-sulfur binding subunit
MMDESRRRFLRDLSAAVGAGCALPLLEPLGRAASAAPVPATAPARQWGMVVDVERCLRPEVRDACIAACHREHNVPSIPDAADEVKWIWTEEYRHAFPDEVHAYTPVATLESPVLVMCNHCDQPACVKVCPTGATWKRESDGIVMMDMHRCIGCRYCMAACPYGARSFNWRDPRPFVERDAMGKPLSDYPTRTKGVVEKCTFCAERLREDREPACVEAVNAVPGAAGALVFGDLTDPTSEVSRILRERNTVCRRAGLGTGPNVYYILPPAVQAAADGGAA